MKIQPGFTLKEVADSFVIVPTGSNIVDFSAMITINETGAFLWECLKEDVTQQQLADMLCKEYDIDMDTALSDVKEFTEALKERKVID